ncbi:MAG TPA: hypothetical protein DE060_15655 [Lentisphaeria bacterium]|nr:hypothetical protein [Lentisphaeria bacterium]HCG50626.1 hypothetical protein [Lentisphaeria bacterium]
MKTAVIALVAVVAAGSLFARDLNINGEFKRLNTAGTAPLGWVKNYANQPNVGTFKVVPAREAGENAIQVTTTTRETPFYTAAAYPVKPGEIVKIEAKVKGKGTAGVAVYLYDAKGYIFSGNLAKVTATDVFTEVEGKHVVKNEYEITRNGVKVKAVPTGVRIVFFAGTNSDITFEDVEAEIDAAK